MTKRKMRVLAGAGSALAGLVVVSAAWATLVTPTKVVGGAGSQVTPAATPGATYLAYAASRPGHPDTFDAYVKPAGQPRIKVNANGQGFTGGISGQTLIFQHIRNGQSNLQTFDLVTHQRTTPTGVNTPAWEWKPDNSGDWMLFGRINYAARPDAYRVLLHNTQTSETRVLDVHTGRPLRGLIPGGLDGDWATWYRFTPKTGKATVVRYQISTEQQLLLPAPTGKQHYSPTVDADGDVFYVRSDPACGANVVIRQHAVDGTDTLLARMPRGIDISELYAVDEGAGVTSVYLTEYTCSTQRSDIYKIQVG